MTGDGVHLNVAGNKFVADQAAAALAKALAVGESSGSVSLFNGKDLSGWHVDVPHQDDHPDEIASLLP